MAIVKSLTELVREIGKARYERDIDRLIELEKCFQAAQTPGPLPFAAAVELHPENVEIPHAAEEAAGVLGAANALSRAKRQVQFQAAKWTGSKVRPLIVSEGDSWFQYPIRLDDVIDVLMDDYLVCSLGAAGDLLANMIMNGEYLESVRDENADFLLLSAVGNDMLHSGRLAEFLNPFQSGMNAESVLHQSRLNDFLDTAQQSFSQVFHRATQASSAIHVLFHGYDYVLPRNEGQWLGGPLASRGVPKNLWAAVVRQLIDKLNEIQIQLANQFDRVHHIDCRGAIGKSPNSWFDELHPTDAGYKRVAARFSAKINELWDAKDETRFTPTEAILAAPASQPSQLHRAAVSAIPASTRAQFVTRASDLAHPSPAATQAVDSEFALDEAQVNPPESRVGPIPHDYIPHVLACSASLNDDNDSSDVELISQILRATATNVLTHGALPETNVDSATVSDAEKEALLRQPPCSSLRAWRVHLAERDPVAVQSYRDYVKVRRRFDEEESPDLIRARLEMLPENDLFVQERIIGRSNLEQINFLSRGNRAARAVGRMSIMSEFGIPSGSGTGFLVGPGLLLTNNHVINARRQAISGSYILFDYEYDADNRLKESERFELTASIFITSQELDFTLVSVAPTGSRNSRIEEYGRLPLIRESGKALKGEEVSIIQHPAGLPKQIAIRESTVVGREGAFVYYYADTNSGSSGSPVLNDQWLPVALHHRSVPNLHKACDYVANRGVRISEIYRWLEEQRDEHDHAMAGKALQAIEADIERPQRLSSNSAAALRGGAVEALKEPFHELPYNNRSGYDDEFLDVRVQMPMVKNPAAVAAPRIDSGGPKFVLHYEHFSLVMHKERRLAIFTACNVDRSPAKRKPEPGKKYNRKALGGLGKNDKEKWFEDPRLSSAHQLSDAFFEKDRQSFDKGHLAMRAAVAWGDTYAEVQRANGDSFHVTNCSPQLADFNRSAFGFTGPWGELEEVVLKEATTEKLVVFAGPLLSESDKPFHGIDNDGDVVIKIPSEYWKLIVARNGDTLQSFAYILEQDLSNVAFEFQPPDKWKAVQVPVKLLEQRAVLLTFPNEIHESDTHQPS